MKSAGLWVNNNGAFHYSNAHSNLSQVANQNRTFSFQSSCDSRYITLISWLALHLWLALRCSKNCTHVCTFLRCGRLGLCIYDGITNCIKLTIPWIYGSSKRFLPHENPGSKWENMVAFGTKIPQILSPECYKKLPAKKPLHILYWLNCSSCYSGEFMQVLHCVQIHWGLGLNTTNIVVGRYCFLFCMLISIMSSCSNAT